MMESNAGLQALSKMRGPSRATLGTDAARGSFMANTLSSAGWIFAQALVNLWLTSFLIAKLGVAAYGMVPLAATLTAFTAVLTTALNSALSRYLVLDLEGADDRLTNRTFNTAFFGLVAILLALCPLILGLCLAFPTLFKVPPGSEMDARFLFALVSCSSFVTVLAGCFQVSPFIYSRFVLINLVNLVGLAARLAVTIALLVVFPARLWFVGVGIALAALVSLVGFVALWQRMTPNLQLRPTAFDLSRLRVLTSMGGWTIVNTLGAMLLSRVDLIVVNAFFGAAITGDYGSLVQFPLLMEYLATAAATTIRPVILIKYAQRDYVGLQRIAAQAVKLLGLFLALPAGLLCGFARPLLRAWLGQPFEWLGILLVLLMFHQAINLSVRPLLWVQTAYNRIRWPGIVTVLGGIASLGLAIVLARWGRWGVAGVPLGVALAWTAKNVVYMPIYTAHIMRQPWWTFLPNLIPATVGTLVAALASWAIARVHTPSNWLELAAAVALVSILYVFGGWSIAMRPADRRLLRDLLPSRRR